MKRLILSESIAYLFILLFLYAGISKFMDYNLFKEQIATSPILEIAAGSIAWIIPLIEIFVSIILFIPTSRSLGHKLSCGLMTLFTIYIAIILVVNNHIPCSCGGIIQSMSWKQHLLFNVACIILSVIGIRSSTTKKEISAR